MINVNLISTSKRSVANDITVLGVDVKAINFKVLIITAIICYGADYGSSIFIKKMVTQSEQEMNTLRGKLEELRKEVSGSQKREELKKYNDKFNELKQINVEVEKVLSQKINPYKLLENMAKEIPEDVWLKRLEITPENTLSLQGSTSAYKSIGIFITKINETAFFNNSLNLEGSETISQQSGSKTLRLEQFNIRGTISSFDPFGN